MKKTVWMFAAALPFVFAACGDENEDDPLSLDRTDVAINYGGEASIKATEKNVMWESSNPFVATVDADGKVTAAHVGEAVITASKDGKTAKCNVTVNATNNNFTMPVITWGSSKDQVKADVAAQKLGLVDGNLPGDDVLGYTTSGSFPMYTYAFVNGGLKASSLIVTQEMDQELDLEGYLDQRYKEYGETKYGFLLCDADIKDDASILIEYGYDADLDAVRATWTTADGTRSGVIIDRSAVDATRRSALKLMGK